MQGWRGRRAAFEQLDLVQRLEEDLSLPLKFSGNGTVQISGGHIQVVVDRLVCDPFRLTDEITEKPLDDISESWKPSGSRTLLSVISLASMTSSISVFSNS